MIVSGDVIIMIYIANQINTSIFCPVVIIRYYDYWYYSFIPAIAYTFY